MESQKLSILYNVYAGLTVAMIIIVTQLVDYVLKALLPWVPVPYVLMLDAIILFVFVVIIKKEIEKIQPV